ncbi:unnamed protein product [Mortierella alpina]
MYQLGLDVPWTLVKQILENRGVGSTTQPKRTKPASRLQNILNNKVNPSNPFVGEDNSSIPSTWTLSSRLKGNVTAGGAEKKPDTVEGNIQNPELFVDTEDGEKDEMVQFGSYTNDDEYAENHATVKEKEQDLSPMSKQKHHHEDHWFTNKNRLSLEGRYRNLEEKWVLESGTVVEDVLCAAGSNENCAVFSFIFWLSKRAYADVCNAFQSNSQLYD